ncbi:membrane protein YqhR [Fontibacillus phaseoli]|uniref:Membrane protein YqhR n=1 Tax=Fontibacillus phaseoli TaxID=1416533 RepID=A0A369BNK8_9BACL|nr:YqhR family membrane protein [Fontibacillus phaseoli]RCX23133.1 membrane protein YqhR [Fontibacillus phaseoli]
MNQQQNRRKQSTNIWFFSLQIGFFAGLIWGGVKGVFYYMRFTSVLPGYLVEPFFKHQFLQTQWGYYVGWLFFILFSIIATLIYTLIFRKLKGPLPGLVYGVFWWFVIFMALGPLCGMTQPIQKLSFNTGFSEFCLFLLWGLFIGYTAAQEYTNERVREPEGALQ